MIKEIFNLQNPWRFKSTTLFDLKSRTILEILLNHLEHKKISGIIGSRQVGKSSLLFLIISHLIHQKNVQLNDIFYFNLDDLKLHELFNNITEFINFVQPGENRKFLLIDEIQRIENPGLFLKEIYDLNLNLKIIYSGSSQLELKSKLREHLVGRSRQFEIQRLSFSEYSDFNHPITRNQVLAEMLIYGAYPEVSLERDTTEKKLSIKDIYQSYIEKDLVDFLKIENIEAFNKLLILLANQIGSLLNIDGLSKSLRITRSRVEKYISILEKTFIIKRIYPFHKNYKKEVTKTPKIYFMDLGLRSFVLSNFNDLSLRNDLGELFENFCLLELLQIDPYSLNKINYWRTTNQTEIDFIVTKGNAINAIEVKWEKSAMPKNFKTIRKHYPETDTRLLVKSDFLGLNNPVAFLSPSL